MGGSRAEQAQGPAQAGLGHQLQGALGPGNAQSRAVHGIMYGAARVGCYRDNMESPSLETRRGASRRMGWERGEMGGGSNPIFTAGTELRAASLKGAGGRAGKREALGHSSVSPSGWQAGRRDADTGPGIRNGLAPDPEEGRWGGQQAHVAPPTAMPVADVTNEA